MVDGPWSQTNSNPMSLLVNRVTLDKFLDLSEPASLSIKWE